MMRWVHMTVVALFAIATIVFAAQNFEIVTVSLLGFDARLPLALVIVLIYLLGMATGSSLLALLRRSIGASMGRAPRAVN